MVWVWNNVMIIMTLLCLEYMQVEEILDRQMLLTNKLPSLASLLCNRDETAIALCRFQESYREYVGDSDFALPGDLAPNLSKRTTLSPKHQLQGC